LFDCCDADVGVAFVFHNGVFGEAPTNGLASTFICGEKESRQPDPKQREKRIDLP
jgi:hypothetical protein